MASLSHRSSFDRVKALRIAAALFRTRQLQRVFLAAVEAAFADECAPRRADERRDVLRKRGNVCANFGVVIFPAGREFLGALQGQNRTSVDLECRCSLW